MSTKSWDTIRIRLAPMAVLMASSPDRVEVLEGLAPGETIAAAGVHHLVEGMRVRAYTN